MSYRALVAEDDPRTRDALLEILRGDGFDVTPARDGMHAAAMLRRGVYDLVCLDVMMPGKSGYDVCRELRRRDTRTPVLFITAKAEEIDMVVGLELGGDDYIVKPFGIAEVLARVHALMRRCGPDQVAGTHDGELQAGEARDAMRATSFTMMGWRIDPATMRATRGDDVVDLRAREIRLLYCLWSSSGRVVRRETMLRAGWPEGAPPRSRTLDQTLSTLRRRLKRDGKAPFQTVYGVGYRFEPEPE